MTVTERKELKALLREVVREELAAQREAMEMPIGSKQVMEITGWSYSKLKRLKDRLGGWKIESGAVMYSPAAINNYLRTVEIR